VIDFLLQEEGQEKVLDVVEASFRLLTRLRSSPEWQNRISQQKFDRAVTELNAGFREYGIGYQYENGEMVRVESQFIHAEVVKPALVLPSAKEYAEAKAKPQCLNDRVKTFESTMKATCTKRECSVKSKDTVKELIDVCLKMA
jgi:hypothetical protein